MTSVMQKDALIEQCMTKAAAALKSGDLDKFYELFRLRKKLYLASFKELDYEKMSEFISSFSFENKEKSLELESVVYKALKDELKPSTNPQVFVLGGQSGASKACAISQILAFCDAIIINSDDFRRFAPCYDEVKGAFDVAELTQSFASALANSVIKMAINERLNVIIEGTFRTTSTPLSTLELFKGYALNIAIMATSASESRKNILERFILQSKEHARYTKPSTHDYIISVLAKNAKEVYEKSGAKLSIYDYEGLLASFDKVGFGDEIQSIIEEKLKLSEYEKNKEFFEKNEQETLKNMGYLLE